MQIKCKSEWMYNQVAGKILPAPQSLQTAYSESASPLIFALDKSAALTLTRPSAESASGWEQINLSAQLAGMDTLGSLPVVQAFTLRQAKDGTIVLVMAAASTELGASALYVTDPLSHADDTAVWRELGRYCHRRTFEQDRRITGLVAGDSDLSEGKPFVLVTAMAEGQMEHYQINPDPEDGSWSYMPLILPENATRCVAAVTGKAPRLGIGVYALCELGDSLNLTFTTLPRVFGGHKVTRSLEFDLPEGLTARTMDSVVMANGETELYVGGNGIYHFSLEAQQESNCPGAWITQNSQCTGLQHMRVQQNEDGGKMGIWAINDQDLLLRTGKLEVDGTTRWQEPLRLGNEVTAIGAFETKGTQSTISSVALGRSDGSFTLLYQDAENALWQKQSVSLQTRDDTVEMYTYTTHIRVLDDDGVPAADREILLKPIFDCAAYVNGQYVALKSAVAKPVRTEGDGTVTIVLESADMACPTYEIQAGGKTVRTDPSEKVYDKLKTIRSGKDISEASRSDGKPLFPNGKSAESCEAAAGLVQRLVKVKDSLPSDGGRRTTKGGGAVTLAQRQRISHYGVRLGPAGTAALSEQEVKALLRPDTAGRVFGGKDEFWVAVGDFFESVVDGVEKGIHILINELEEGWEFVVEFGDKVVHFIFEAASQVWAATNWLLKHTLGIDLDEILAWLGFVFNWDDILRNHRVAVHVMNLGFDHIVHEVGELENKVKDAFDSIRGRLIDDKLVVDQSNEIFRQRARQATPESSDASDGPTANWAQHQLQVNADSVKTGSDTDSLEGLFADLAETELDIIIHAVNQIDSQIFDRIDELSFGDILDEILQIIGAAILNTMENVALTVLEAVELLIKAFKAVLNTRWDIPVLTYMYEEVICGGDGSKLTLLDVLCLLTAIPATVMYKAAAGRNPFTEAQAQAVTSSRDWNQLISVMAGKPMAPSDGMAGGKAADASASSSAASAWRDWANVFLCLSASTRLVSCTLYPGQAVAKGPIKNTLAKVRTGLNWCTTVFGMTTVSLQFVEKKEIPTSQWIDSFMVYSQVVLRIKESAVLFLDQDNNRAMKIKKGLDYAHSAYGFAIMVSACVSLGFKLNEPKPDDQPEERWKTEISLKFVQDALVGLFWGGEFVSTMKDSQAKYILIGVRSVCFILGSDSGVGLALAKVLDNTKADALST